ncbi:MAG: hypothetical protein U1C97_03620 [Candidatus Gracilibacteria bacterium]|nr:hypothetical protein [bacterium]MDZ4217374.1 hypothetical protein [Candidatus Gracilibacteria bacterium]
MPLAIFLITVIISGSLYGSIARVHQDSFVNQTLLASTAAFYTASSSAEVSWTEVNAENSLDVVAAFTGQSTDAEGESPESQDYLPGLFVDLDEDDQKSLELNMGIEAASIQTKVELNESSFVDRYFQSSAEVFLYEVPLDLVIDRIRVDFCLDKVDTSCTLIVEWFRLDKDEFSFQDVESLADQDWDLSSLSACLEYSELGIKRCVLNSALGSRDQLNFVAPPEGSKYTQSMILSTSLSGYHYLFRFRTMDHEQVHFAMYGESGGDRAALPTAFFEIDELGRSQNSFRRIRQQQVVSGGLQDGLEYAQYSETVQDK